MTCNMLDTKSLFIFGIIKSIVYEARQSCPTWQSGRERNNNKNNNNLYLYSIISMKKPITL